jgi:hypothetical protein
VFLSCIIGFAKSTADWTNLDLTNYEYFKYPKTTVKPYFVKHRGTLYSIRKIPKPPSKIEDTVNRGKAIVTYFRNLAFGKPGERMTEKLVLDPDFGRKWSNNYQSKYGRFGKNLVDLIGSGPTKQELIAKNVIEY